MNVNRNAVYAVAALAVLGGVWLMFSGDEKKPDAAAAPAPKSEAVVRGTKGGYMGTGEAQVTIESQSPFVAAPQQMKGDAVASTPEQLESIRRTEELHRVLGNIQGEPVYVEGIDGPPAPKKTDKKAAKSPPR